MLEQEYEVLCHGRVLTPPLHPQKEKGRIVRFNGKTKQLGTVTANVSALNHHNKNIAHTRYKLTICSFFTIVLMQYLIRNLQHN